MMSQQCDHSSPLEIVFQEQSYSSLHSRWSLAWDHFRGNIDDPCGVIADFCRVIADFCGVIAHFCVIIAYPCYVTIREAIGVCPDTDAAIPIVARPTKYRKTLLNIVKNRETLVKHCDTS